MDFENYGHHAAGAVPPGEPGEDDKIFSSEANVRNVGAGDATENFARNKEDSTDNTKGKHPEELLDLSSGETPLDTVPDSQGKTIASQPQPRDGSDQFELLAHAGSDSKDVYPEERDSNNLLAMESSSPGMNVSNAAGQPDLDHDAPASAHENIQPVHGEDDIEDRDMPAPPPLESAMLGDYKLPGMPSTSSLDVEPPTPTQHSDEEDSETTDEVLLRARGAQRLQDMEIPPAPDKPLPPTPGDEPKTVAPLRTATPGSVKACLSIGKMTGYLIVVWRRVVNDPRVMELLLWRDPARSGAALAIGLVVLISMMYFSFISVVAYLSLALLTVTLGFRLYKTIMGAVQKTNDGHPFQDLLSVDCAVSEEKGHELADKMVTHLNCGCSTLKDLFLIKDIFESIKFGFALYLLTYVGACFNTMTLVIMGYVAAFTLPKVYEMNKEQIDQVMAQVKEKMADISTKVKAAIPMGKKTEAAVEVSEEKKDE